MLLGEVGIELLGDIIGYASLVAEAGAITLGPMAYCVRGESS